MAAAATTLLALCALLAGTGAENQCSTKTLGDLTDLETSLLPLSLDPPQRTWLIQSPVDAACARLHGRAVGVMVTACDPNSPPPPTVQILSLRQVIVTRNSYYLTSPLHVYVNVYCRRNLQKDIKDAKEVGEAGEVAGVVGKSRSHISRLRATVVGGGGRGVLTAVPLG